MGQFTPNIGLYIPAAGETNYNDSFASGMINLDLHDHSGGPNKGVPITSSGLGDFSVTYNKLAANVADPNTGIGVNLTPGLQHQLQILGILRNIFTLASVPGVGFISMNGSTVAARSMVDSGSIAWTNPDGVAAAPSAALISPVIVGNGGLGVNTLTPYAPLLAGTTPTGAVQQPAIGNSGDVLTSQGAGLPSVFAPLGGLGQLQTTTITLTAAQIRTLNASPVQIVAAPGAGKVLVPIVCYGLMTQSGTAFVGPFPNPAITIAYNATNAAMSFSQNAFVTVTSDVYNWATQSALPTVGGIAKASVQNVPLFLKNFATEYTGGGSSTITFVLSYITITL